MRRERYEVVTGTCLLTVVISALLFDRAGSLRWLVGSLGIAAGVSAVIAYFCERFIHEANNDLRVTDGNSVPISKGSDFEGSPTLLTIDEVEGITRSSQIFITGSSDEWPLVSTKHLELDQSHFARGPLLFIAGADTALAQYVAGEYTRPATFHEEVIEIVKALSSEGQGSSFVFTLSPAGDFTIRFVSSSEDNTEHVRDVGDVRPAQASYSRKVN